MSGTKGHSGRRRRATAQRNGRVYVALDRVQRVNVNAHTFAAGLNMWWVDNDRYTDYAAASAEFVRRVNG